MDKKLREELMMDENVRQDILASVLAFAMAIPGFVSKSKAMDIITSSNSVEQIQKTYLKETSPICSVDKLGYSAGQIINIVSRTLFAEAGGEGEKGLRAVASVIWNRARQNPKNLTSICFAPKQFSCWNGASPLSNPNYSSKKYQLSYPKSMKTNSKKELEIWRNCVKIAEEMVLDRFICLDGLENANQYAKTDILSKLDWKMTNTVEIGKHTFGTVPSRFYFYDVKENETLESIAKKLFPDSTYSKYDLFLSDIQKLNPAIKMKAGVQVRIPKKI